MFCKNCGAALADGARFCGECGSPVDAVPAGASIDREDNPIISGSPAHPPVQPSAGKPVPPPAYGVSAPGYPPQAQPGVYAQPAPGAVPAQGQPGFVPPQGTPYVYPGQVPSAAKPKKKHTAVIVLAALLALAVLCGVLFFVVGKLREEKPPLPIPTEHNETEIATGDASDPSSTEAESAPASADPTTAPADDAFTDEQANALLRRLQGVWNSADDTMLISISPEEDGSCFFALGYWFSEYVLKGYLRQPIKGDPDGIVSVWLFYEGEDGGDFFSDIPSMDEAISFDLSDYENGVLRWNNGEHWIDFYYGGATMDEAMPEMY